MHDLYLKINPNIIFELPVYEDGATQTFVPTFESSLGYVEVGGSDAGDVEVSDTHKVFPLIESTQAEEGKGFFTYLPVIDDQEMEYLIYGPSGDFTRFKIKYSDESPVSQAGLEIVENSLFINCNLGNAVFASWEIRLTYPGFSRKYSGSLQNQGGRFTRLISDLEGVLVEATGEVLVYSKAGVERVVSITLAKNLIPTSPLTQYMANFLPKWAEARSIDYSEMTEYDKPCSNFQKLVNAVFGVPLFNLHTYLREQSRKYTFRRYPYQIPNSTYSTDIPIMDGGSVYTIKDFDLYVDSNPVTVGDSAKGGIINWVMENPPQDFVMDASFVVNFFEGFDDIDLDKSDISFRLFSSNGYVISFGFRYRKGYVLFEAREEGRMTYFSSRVPVTENGAGNLKVFLRNSLVILVGEEKIEVPFTGTLISMNITSSVGYSERTVTCKFLNMETETPNLKVTGESGDIYRFVPGPGGKLMSDISKLRYNKESYELRSKDKGLILNNFFLYNAMKERKEAVAEVFEGKINIYIGQERDLLTRLGLFYQGGFLSEDIMDIAEFEDRFYVLTKNFIAECSSQITEPIYKSGALRVLSLVDKPDKSFESINIDVEGRIFLG